MAARRSVASRRFNATSLAAASLPGIACALALPFPQIAPQRAHLR
jgi:hypothetical protein